MAQGGSGDPVIHKVWTFLIRGGEEFTLIMPRTPRLEHDGQGMTMWKMVGTKRAADSVKAILEESGATVELHTEEQNPEQEAIRNARLGRGLLPAGD